MRKVRIPMFRRIRPEHQFFEGECQNSSVWTNKARDGQGHNSNVWTMKVKIAVFGRIRSEFQRLEK